MFCKNCGSQIPDGTAQCPNCGAPTSVANSAPVNSYSDGNGGNSGNSGDGIAILALVLGIVSIVTAILGAIMFGVFGTIIGLGTGITALILGINERKKGKAGMATGGFVCGLLGTIIAVFMAIGCASCASCMSCDSCSGEMMDLSRYERRNAYYGFCYGCVGGSCASNTNGCYNPVSTYYSWYY